MTQSRRRIKKQNAESSERVKAPSVSEERSTQSEKPIFCLEHIDRKFCISKCNRKEKAAFTDTIHKLSQLTWNQIQNNERHRLGCETISHSSIRGRKPNHMEEDVRILAIRFSGKAPMVGYRDGRVFHIIWIDRKFKLYKHS